MVDPTEDPQDDRNQEGAEGTDANRADTDADTDGSGAGYGNHGEDDAG